MGRLMGGGGLCERRVMNVDVNRERCRVPGLDQAKLRRVAFCVDVEIAGGPSYVNDDVDDKAKRARKEQDKKLKEKEEGEALKHPDLIKGEASVAMTEKIGEQVEQKQDAIGPGHDEGQKEISKKKEKKKRSEAERKEKKEKKRRQAEANGTIPIENLKNSDGSSCGTTPSDESPSRSQYHPTTDPLRIYRRCCQLRETNALKVVTEQLLAPKGAAVAPPGVVTCLDLSDQRIQLADIVTLADWLAVVPVKKLKLDNCDLGDEAIRVILGGLLASKIPDTEGKVSPEGLEKGNLPDGDAKKRPAHERYGVCERLSLKNNPKIGRDGWRYISLFLHLCRSIKAIDLSMIPFPRTLKSGAEKNAPVDMASLLSEALSKRLAGSHLEELIMSECELSTEDIDKVIQGISNCRLRRLGLASNHLTPDGLQHIARFLTMGICEGLDIGGNNLQNLLQVIAEALDSKNPLYDLSLSDCNLIPSSLSQLFPALVSLPNFRFIDLSHNQQLFSTQPNALGLLRKYLPRLRQLKRIHLEDAALSSEHVIALAEILPEIPNLAHLSILENSQLSALVSARDDTSQEEACALYASMMAAVRVSKTIIRIDIDVPSPDSCEVVKALAKQVVAYCLRNMERGPVAEYDSTTTVTETSNKQVAVPEVLLHIVGHVEGYPQDLGGDEPAPDHDYVIGGTGVVKALGVCLGNNSNDSRRWSGEGITTGSGTATPKATFRGGDLGKGKAKEMSKNLLGSARKIRERLQPALIRESKTGDGTSYRKFSFQSQYMLFAC